MVQRTSRSHQRCGLQTAASAWADSLAGISPSPRLLWGCLLVLLVSKAENGKVKCLLGGGQAMGHRDPSRCSCPDALPPLAAAPPQWLVLGTLQASGERWGAQPRAQTRYEASLSSCSCFSRNGVSLGWGGWGCCARGLCWHWHWSMGAWEHAALWRGTWVSRWTAVDHEPAACPGCQEGQWGPGVH